jgi:glycosyltransferase involved in cell wall biosynthesis/predicted negative regulator of RcsB-dependent stress response
MLGLAMIVKGDEQEALQLRNALGFIKEYVDGIFITATYKQDIKECIHVEDICKEFGATISYFKWCNDFSKARNYNFSQVPKEYEYIIWQDADDGIRGADKIKTVLEENKDVDAFAFDYLYAFDEWNNPTVVHKKSRIIRNDGCVRWEGALHEDFKRLRNVVTKYVEGIEWIHLSQHERFEAAKKRNLEVAKSQMLEFPNDPRSYWNVANSYKALGDNDSAIISFTKFLEMSDSDDERYIIRLRIAECFWSKNEKPLAVEQTRYAIGLKFNFPDAYFLLGSLYFEMKQFDKAEEVYLEGLAKVAVQRKIQQLDKIYNKIIVFNPRDYDYVPLMNLAKVYFNTSRPDRALTCLEGCLKIYPKDKGLKKLIGKMKVEKEKFDKVFEIAKKLDVIKDDNELAKELKKVEDEFKSHPAICLIRNKRFQKKESSGKDLVIYCGQTAKEWHPDIAKNKGVGGSEEAVIHLSKGLAEKGWNVTVYNNCGHKELQFGKVLYKPYWAYNYRDKQDVTIIWRGTILCDYEMNSSKVYIDLHDCIDPGEFTEKRLAKIDKIFVKSKFHRNLYPDIPDEKFVIIPNGIEVDKFNGEYVKDRRLLINTSSPDRSVRALAYAFKKIKAKVPDVKCKWAYGWDIFDVAHGDNTKLMKWKDEMKALLKEVGIEELGMISHEEVAKLYQEGAIFAYPSEFAEIDCISLSKAMSAGCVPVTTNFAAMGEKMGYGGYFLPSRKNKDTWCKDYQYDFGIDDVELLNAWADSVVQELTSPTGEETVKQMREYALNTYNWKKIIDQWNNNL